MKFSKEKSENLLFKRKRVLFVLVKNGHFNRMKTYLYTDITAKKKLNFI